MLMFTEEDIQFNWIAVGILERLAHSYFPTPICEWLRRNTAIHGGSSALSMNCLEPRNLMDACFV